MNYMKYYHDNIWLPFSKRVDRWLDDKPTLLVYKKLFDVHFTILSLIGIIAPPKDDVECYYYAFKRYPKGKHRDKSYRMRLFFAWYLIRWALNKKTKQRSR